VIHNGDDMTGELARLFPDGHDTRVGEQGRHEDLFARGGLHATFHGHPAADESSTLSPTGPR